MAKDKDTTPAILFDLASLGTDFSAEDVRKSAERAVLPSESCFVELYGFDPTDFDEQFPSAGVGYQVRVITGFDTKTNKFTYGGEFVWNNLFGNLARFNPNAKMAGEDPMKELEEAKVRLTGQNNRAIGELVRNMTDGRGEVGDDLPAMQKVFNTLFAAGTLPVGIYNPSTNQPSYKSRYKHKPTNTWKESTQQDRADVSWGGTTRNSAIKAIKEGKLTPPDVRGFVRSRSQAVNGPTMNTGGGDAPGGLGTEPPADE